VRRYALVLLALSLVSASCKKQTAEKPYVCKAEVASGEAKEVSAGEVPFDIWFQIMLTNFNRETMEVKRPVRDCSGREVEVPKLDEASTACLAGKEPPKVLPERPLVEEDLLITPIDNDQLLVWVKVKHFDSGESEGPIGIADFTKGGVAVRSIGTLRAHTDKAAMHLEPLGKDRVLVIESRRCDPKDPKKCDRLTRLVPLIGNNFLEKPLLDPKGGCLGPPIFEMFRELTVTLDSGMSRKFEMARSIDYTDGNVVVAEQIVIKDTDPRQPDEPPKTFRQANVDRELTVLDNGIKTAEGLWEKMVAEHGSVVYKAPPRPPAETQE
jgi:hypothetical protein